MKVINILILVALILSFPILGFLIVFGLAGSTSKYAAIIGFGYLFAISTAVISFYWNAARYAPLFGVLLILVGFALDSLFWTKHNKELCMDLRANPTCQEDETGFYCSDFHGTKFSTSKAICKDVSEQI